MGVTVLIDVLAWLGFHLGISWWVLRWPAAWFTNDQRFRPFPFERSLYEDIFFIRRWKTYLPDAAPWLGGFAKKSFQSKDALYARRFLSETRRAEVAHWLTFLVAPIFFLWNPPAVGGVMIVYAALANAPCIMAQRYNRHRLLHRRKS